MKILPSLKVFYYIPLTVLATSSFLLGSLVFSIITSFQISFQWRLSPFRLFLKTNRNSTEISWHQYSESLGTSVEEESTRSNTVGAGCCFISDRIFTTHCVLSQYQTWSFKCCESANRLLGSVSKKYLFMIFPSFGDLGPSFPWLSTFVYGYRSVWTRFCTTWRRQKCERPQSAQ